MSNPTRYQQWSQPLMIGRLGYAAEQEPDPDPEDPTDYASQELGGAVQVGIDVGSVALVQENSGHQGASPITVTFGATPAQGNMLFAALFVRGNGTLANMNNSVSPGWTKHPETPAGSTAGDGGRFYLWYKTAGASETVTVRVDATDVKDLYIAEWSGLDGSLDSSDHLGAIAATTSMVTGSITPTSSDGLLLAAFVQASRNAALTLDATYTEELDVDVDPSGPSGVFGSKIVDPFTGSYSTSATSDQSDGYGWFLGAFGSAAGGVVWFPGPAANDDDSATSAFSDSTPATLRVALDVERLIYRMELDIGQETAGATVYELYGTDDATFASSTLLGTLTFTATGSFTLDAEVLSWVPTASYQYYELQHVSGGGSDREFYEVRLFSAVGVLPITEHGDLTGRDVTDQHPADAVSYDNGTSGLTATEVQGAIDELAATGGGLAVEDEGTPLTTDATTLNFTGSGVTASGAGTTKTINIPGAGGGQGLVDFAFAARTGGNVTANNTSWTNVDTGIDLTVSASTADRCRVTLSGGAFGTEAVTLNLTAMSIVSGSPVNDIATATTPSNTTNGVGAWRAASGSPANFGGGIMYAVQAGDISGGSVTFRLRYRTASATNRVITASDPALVFMVENIGPAM